MASFDGNIEIPGGPAFNRSGFKGQLGSDGMTYPVAFLHYMHSDSTGAGLAGLLISENSGIPLEFIITHAVRPTAAQKVLYGKSLRRHIAVDLCAKQLLESVKTKPQVIFINNPELFLASKHTDIPILHLQSVEQLGSGSPEPVVEPDPSHPEHGDLLDIRSLHIDMLDCFSRIEQCREILARSKEEYKL